MHTAQREHLNMGELLPCPFCGGEATFRDHSTCEADVACMNCCASLKVTTAGNWEVTHDTAITAWNTRPRTEGRGDQEPVAWQEAAEPFFRLAREVINPVNGERPWHADSKDWMVVFSFAGQSVTLGDLRRAAVASPIREPEISKPDRELAAREAFQVLHPYENWNDLDERYDPRGGYHPMQIKAFEVADAILNLASPVAKGASQDAELSDEFDRPGRLSDATRHSAEGTADPALSGARGVVTPVGGRGEEGSSQSQPVLSPKSDTDVQRDLTGETVCGFRVAAWRETHPEHGDRFGHTYSEHWSTPSANPRVTVERLFTETQLRAALSGRPLGAEDGQLRDEQNPSINEESQTNGS